MQGNAAAIAHLQDLMRTLVDAGLSAKDAANRCFTKSETAIVETLPPIVTVNVAERGVSWVSPAFVLSAVHLMLRSRPAASPVPLAAPPPVPFIPLVGSVTAVSHDG